MKEQKGITLVALVITIIVMLILVTVSISVALNGGLFKNAGDAANNTAVERNAEYNLSSGKVTVDNVEKNVSDYGVTTTAPTTSGQTEGNTLTEGE